MNSSSNHRLLQILLVTLILSSVPLAAERVTGHFQSTGRISAHAIAAEGDYIYVVGNAVNHELAEPGESLDLGGGMKDIWLVKLNKEGVPVFSALIGGSDDDSAFDLVVKQGVVYILGETWSTDFPGSPGSGGERDAVLLALAADGSQLLWSRRLGGSDQDAGRAIALQDDSLFITGISWSQDFVAGAAKGDADGFLARLGLDGSLDWLKIFGGSAFDAPFDLKVTQNEIWVAGQSFSKDFGGPHQGDGDAFAARFNLAGESDWVRLYGGAKVDSAFAVYPNEDGGVYLAGGTRTATLPDAMGDYGGNYDAFLMKIAVDGALNAINYLGGTGIDYAHDVIQLPDGDVFLVGETFSPTFPLGYDHSQDTGGSSDAFVVRLNPDGQVLSSWIEGGSEAELARSMALTDRGLWLVGRFSEDLHPNIIFMSFSELESDTLPEPQVVLPTATNAPSATPQQTATPFPTHTPTPLPNEPLIATLEIENLTVPEVADVTSTLSTEERDSASVLETSQIVEGSGTPSEAAETTSKPTAATNHAEATATMEPEGGTEIDDQEGLSTGLIVGAGLLMVVGLGGTYYWMRRNNPNIFE